MTSLGRNRLATALAAALLATVTLGGPVSATSATRLRPARPFQAAARAHLPARAYRKIKAGDRNVAIADRPVPRPDTTPCIVPLFSGLMFEDYNPKPFQYAPPTACPGPWARVVLEVDLSVTAGIQFDRTATIGVGGATIFFGTTAEPDSNLAPSWHVARDLTDLSALFAGSQNGQVSIGNTVSGPYTGIIEGSARLAFYPPDRRYPAPLVADQVVPLADSNGNPVELDTTSSQLTASFTPPRNVTRAYLDVISQSQSTDEFWYTCVPNDLTGPLNDCGNTSFRETEVAVDSRPAGVAPVYPWIYTGGIDPFLWQPTPGVQTLNFVPYRVDLTPFAGSLDDGAVHQVAISVFNADNYFASTGNLLLFLDHSAKAPLSGAIDSDTLAAAPPETTTEHGNFAPSGTVDTNSHRSFTIAGHVNTPRGTINTVVTQTDDFRQDESIVNSATEFRQNIHQNSRVVSKTTRTGNEAGSGNSKALYDFPLDLDYDYVVAGDGTATQTTTIRQSYFASTSHPGEHGVPVTSYTMNSVRPTDELHFDANGNFTGNTNAANLQLYRYITSTGKCYGKEVQSANNAVTGVGTIPC